MSEWLQESLKRDKVIDNLRLWVFFLTVALMVVSIALLIVTTRHAAAQSDLKRVKCTTVGGPIPLGTERVTVPLKCCPPGMYVANPNQPALDKHDNLICVEET
jgi:hypothetical protein